MFVVINITEASSMTDRDDDYCVSYTVTVVDVRRCTRPPRLFCPKSATYIGNVCIIIKYSGTSLNKPSKLRTQ